MYLQGTFTATKDENGKKICTYPLKLSIPDSPSKGKNNSGSKDSEKSKLEEMRDQLRDLQINWISKFGEEESQSIYDKLVVEHDSHIPLHVARIQALDAQMQTYSFIRNKDDKGSTTVSNGDVESGNKNNSTVRLESAGNGEKLLLVGKDLLKTCDKILTMIDRPALLAFYGSRSNSAQVDAAKTKQSTDRQKTALVEALVKKGLVFCEYYHLKTYCNLEPDVEVTLEDLDAIMFELQRFADMNDPKVTTFCATLYSEHQI